MDNNNQKENLQYNTKKISQTPIVKRGVSILWKRI